MLVLSSFQGMGGCWRSFELLHLKKDQGDIARILGFWGLISDEGWAKICRSETFFSACSGLFLPLKNNEFDNALMFLRQI